MKLFKYLCIAIFFIGLSNENLAQVKNDTLSVLFVGNSYTYFSNMPQIVSLISDRTAVKLITSKSTAGGATLSNHWNGEKGLKTKERITNGNYDIVVLQEHSMGTIEGKDDFLKYSKKLSDLIKDSGAKPYFYVTWAREKVPQYQETITGAYQQAARKNGCGLVLVGEAWKQARALRPGIELFTADGSHPSDLGAFLTACVFAKTLSGTLPEKIPSAYFTRDIQGETILLMAQNSLDVTFCLKVIQEL